MLQFRKKHTRTSSQKLSSKHYILTIFSLFYIGIYFHEIMNPMLKKLVKSWYDKKLQLFVNWKAISSTDLPLLKRQGMNFDKRGGWNKRGGWKIFMKSINVEGGFFLWRVEFIKIGKHGLHVY